VSSLRSHAARQFSCLHSRSLTYNACYVELRRKTKACEIIVDNTIDLEPIARLTRDLKSASVTLGDDEARFLVDAYYIMQEDRKRYYAQDRTLEEGKEPNEVIKWFARQSETLEKQIARALDAYASHHPVGTWLYSVYGVGPVISAGLFAHIDIERAPTVGHIYSFGGYAGVQAEETKHLSRAIYRATYAKPYDRTTRNNVPELEMEGDYKAVYLYPDDDTKKRKDIAALFQVTVEGDAKPKVIDGEPEFLTCEFVNHRVYAGSRPWLAKQKRPFNADLKTLFWKIGQSFLKFSNVEDCFYGGLYRQRKEFEVNNNEEGKLAHIAAQRVDTVDKDTDAYKAYSIGKLPPAHIDARARRFAVKMFLSDLHAVWYFLRYKVVAPRPYVVDHLGHAHWRMPHHIELVPGMEEAYRRRQPVVRR
jgi:hypothetical protein